MNSSASLPHGATRKPAYWPWLLWAALLIGIDQFTKQWILSFYAYGDWTPSTGFFNIVRAHGGWQRWLFVGIGVIATLLIVWQLRKHPEQKFFCFAIASILGGAIGNVVDRLMHGYVVDFLDFHWGGWHYPAFNVADIAICTGAACLVLDEVLRSRRARRSA